MKTREWRALIRKLRERFPVQGQVTVRRYPTKKDCGLTTFDGSGYRVRVNSDQPDGGQVDTLLHESAHVRAIEQAYRHGGRGACFTPKSTMLGPRTSRSPRPRSRKGPSDGVRPQAEG